MGRSRNDYGSPSCRAPSADVEGLGQPYRSRSATRVATEGWMRCATSREADGA